MPKPLKSEKPKAIQVLEVGRTRRFIRIHYRKGDEDFKIRSNDNPLPAFTKALDALVPLVCTTCEVPSTWATNLRILGIAIGTMRDAKTGSIRAQKSLALSGGVMDFVTPAALLSTPTTEGAVTPTLSLAQADLYDEVVEQAKRYIRGERAQGVMDFGEDEDDEDEDLSLFQEPAKSKAK